MQDIRELKKQHFSTGNIKNGSLVCLMRNDSDFHARIEAAQFAERSKLKQY